tara:strand:+ start:222 stop:416 length:195 start_codon:yes stop_codon:yes gene_type:complete
MGWMCISEHMNISQDQFTELLHVLEDTVEYYCDQQQVSGELAWTAVQALSAGKILLLKGATKVS